MTHLEKEEIRHVLGLLDSMSVVIGIEADSNDFDTCRSWHTHMRKLQLLVLRHH